MKPPSSRNCSKVRYINITSPPYGREKRNLLPSVKGSNRHHLGVPPGLAPTRIIQHLIAKVNMGCACRILFLLPKITVFETENAFGNRESHLTRKIDFRNKNFPKYTSVRVAVQETVKRISLTFLACLRVFLTCKSCLSPVHESSCFIEHPLRHP